MNKEIPTGVRIISILMYISFWILIILGVIALFGGLYALFDPGFQQDIISQTQNEAVRTITSAIWLLILFGIGAIVFSVLLFFIIKNFKQGKNWAKIVVIILTALYIIENIIGFIRGASLGIISIVINLVIIGYLLFSKEVKEFFK